MISSTEIAPLPALSAFIRCYTFREFDTKGLDLVKPFHAPHEICMNFFFRGKAPRLIDPKTNAIIKEGTYGSVVGLGTHYNGDIIFNGSYSFFEVAFKPNGFSRLYGVLANEITNTIIDTSDIFGSSVRILYDKLIDAHSLQAMAMVVNDYFLRRLDIRKSNNRWTGITTIANSIMKMPGSINIEAAASQANMCLRNFERRFDEQIGMPPKLFCRLSRFNHAFEDKLKNPTKDWVSIAFDHGYFDQNHLIKDFKKFAGSPPKTFLKQTPLTTERYSNRIED